MSKMKVVMLSTFTLESIMSSGANMYEEKLNFYLLQHKNIDIHLIVIDKEDKKINRGDLTIHVLKDKKFLPFKILYSPIVLFKIKHKIIDIDPDIVHVLSTFCTYGIAAAMLRDKYASLVTAYGITVKETKYYAEDLEKWYKKIIYSTIYALFLIIRERYILSRIPNIVVDTESIKDLVTSWTQSKIYIVPAGVEYDKVKKIGDISNLNEIPDIFFVNNLQKIKGADILIKSVQEVRKSFPDITVFIAGTGPQKNVLKNLVNELNLEKNVKFLGFISNKEKYQHYKACKVIVIPSRWDCQPAAFFDAAALGKPVIASNMSNPGVLINGKTGLIFKSENFEDLAAKINFLLENEKMRENMGIKAQKNIAQYDWNEVAAHYFKIYKEIIKNFSN